MSRHGKNNCTRAYFTNHEREKCLPGWGTQKARVGSDFLLDFGACPICLKAWVSPTACDQGHVFCKECIYTALLNQKQDNDKAMESYKNTVAVKDHTAAVAASSAAAAEVEAFEENETGIASRKRDKPDGAGGGETTSSGMSAMPFARGREGLVVDRKDLGCFWVPSVGPEAAKTEVKEPSMATHCPGSEHPLRLKQLFPLNLTKIPGIDERDPHCVEVERYLCPGCSKTMGKGTRVACVKACGHVFCQLCVDRIIKKDERCITCSKKAKSKHIVKLVGGGTGFAAHGDKIDAKKHRASVSLS